MNTLPNISQPTPTLRATGAAFIIRCVPDPFTQECLNIGVCVIDADGQRQARVITEPGRLKYLYGDQAYAVVNMAQVALSCALAGLTPPSDQIIFSEPTPFYHQDAAQALESLFRDQVTIARPPK